MRKPLTLIPLFALVLGAMVVSSCKSDGTESSGSSSAVERRGDHRAGNTAEQGYHAQPEQIKLGFGDTLKYDLGYFGDEDRARIVKHPRYNALEGFCSREPVTYCYTATTRFEGSDTIVFELSFGSDGSGPGTEDKSRELIIELKKD